MASLHKISPKLTTSDRRNRRLFSWPRTTSPTPTSFLDTISSALPRKITTRSHRLQPFCPWPLICCSMRIGLRGCRITLSSISSPFEFSQKILVFVNYYVAQMGREKSDCADKDSHTFQRSLEIGSSRQPSSI